VTETRADAWANVAGLLSRMGYQASVAPAYSARGGSPVLALVTDAPEMVVGMAIGLVAEEPEAHIPTKSAKVPRTALGKPGDPQFAWWA